jgi:hypothetical protein
MQIARVKAVCDPRVGRDRDDRLPAHRPVADQRPLIQREFRWCNIDDVGPVLPRPATRYTALC